MSKGRRSTLGTSGAGASAATTIRRRTSNSRPASERALALRRRRTHRVIAGVLAAAVVVGAVSLAFFNHPSSAGYRTTTEGWVLPRLGAPGKVSLAAFKGRPVIVNFFASWCTVCASELPVFTKEIV